MDENWRKGRPDSEAEGRWHADLADTDEDEYPLDDDPAAQERGDNYQEH